MKRPLLFAACLFLPIMLTGCMVPYCAYPRMDSTPSRALDGEPEDIHVFRVDALRGSVLSGLTGSHREDIDETLTRVPLLGKGAAPSQSKLSLTYGIATFWPMIPAIYHIRHPMTLRLYRPGYELVEIKPGDPPSPVVWKPAPDLAAQQKVLATLLPLERLGKDSRSPAHREALLFGVSEYERLATLAESAELKEELRGRAEKLQELAQK